ncbi:MAG: isoamylase [Simkaniaceae bacterium]|nr:isoamylase [Candidatus Sacchlamyda saccharinae]
MTKQPSPPDGVHFAIYAPSAKEVTLGIFIGERLQEFPLTRSGDNWTTLVPDLPKNSLYAFRIEKEWILDPFAKELNRSATWGEKPKMLLGKVFPDTGFDWEGDRPLNLPFESLILYEMHIRGLTKDPSSKVARPGTFLGAIEKIPYLKELGVNAVELLPIFSFDETTPNYWGYSSENFFAPMAPYGTISEFKQMVKAFHKAGIEVILDVVYNHVGSDSFQKEVFFILDQNKEHTNYTGCGNTISCNKPHVIEFILASLCYYVTEMHVDGFRFDLASIFTRGPNGEVLENPPLISAIENCPALKNTKLIAEPWDCGGLYQVGSFPSPKFAEWNGQFRDHVRRFLKGSDQTAGPFASVMCGSANLYEGKKAPFQSINFVTAHDGFTLRDLVSYNEKHNEENGEENRDGNSFNESWNCGVEGETKDSVILRLREQQMRNFLLSLFMAIGTPMLLMGDEYGHSRQGNNNAYCLDNQKNYFLWGQNQERIDFVKRLIQLRKSLPLLQRKTFLTDKEITWHTPSWDGRLVAYSLHEKNTHLFLAFNANSEGAHLTLPKGNWIRKIDTTLEKQSDKLITGDYYLPPHSSLMLLS